MTELMYGFTLSKKTNERNSIYMSVTFDISNNAPYLLEIRQTQTDLAGNLKEAITILDATDEDGVAEWLSNQFGEKLHELNGCPLYMELSSWAS